MSVLAMVFIGLRSARDARGQGAAYTVVDLGPVGTFYSSAQGINASGQVAGYDRPSVSSSNVRALLFNGGTVTDLGSLGGNISQGYGINASSHVVGGSTTAGGATHAFRYSGGVMTDLGTLGGADSRASGINASGQVVGYSSRADGSTHAFRYSGGVMTDLGSLGGLLDISYAMGVNDGGQVVGYSYTPSFQVHAVLWSSGTATDLGTLGGASSEALAINASGKIAGTADVSGGAGSHAFVYSGGVMTNLGTLGGRNSQANAINTTDQVVGQSEFIPFSSFTHAFVYTGGMMTDLNTLLPAGSEWTLTQATGINDAGRVVGTGIAPDGYQHAFLMTPNSATSFYTLTPCRVVDTRNPDGPLGGPALSGMAQRLFPITGTCSIPSTAKAISVNIAVTQPSDGGHLSLFPGGNPLPISSAINYGVGQTRSNNAIVPLGALGDLAVYCAQGSGTTTHFILDVYGYFQ